MSFDVRKATEGLFGMVVSTSDCHPRGPGFHSRLYPRNYSGSIGSGTRSSQSREDNWVAILTRISEIQLRKLKLRLRGKLSNNIYSKFLNSL